jgi:hypothetical protein
VAASRSHVEGQRSRARQSRPLPPSLWSVKHTRGPCAPPEALAPSTLDISPAKRQLLRVPKWRPWAPSRTPATAGSRGWFASWGGGQAPVVAVLVRARDKKGTRAHLRPQRRRPPRTLGHFSCKRATSEGAEEEAKGADHGPLQRNCWRLCARVAGGGGHAPLWQYFSRLLATDDKKTTRIAKPLGKGLWKLYGRSSPRKSLRGARCRGGGTRTAEAVRRELGIGWKTRDGSRRHAISTSPADPPAGGGALRWKRAYKAQRLEVERGSKCGVAGCGSA